MSDDTTICQHCQLSVHATEMQLCDHCRDLCCFDCLEMVFVAAGEAFDFCPICYEELVVDDD